jgi:phosphatidyl-myo-inositol dimannoside synthase
VGLAIPGFARQTLPVIIGLFSELDSPGGIQRAGRHVAAVLTEFAKGRGMECRLLSLNESPELHRMSVGGREFVFTGSDGGKARFTAAALRAARRRAQLVVAVHPHLAPVARGLRIIAPRIRSVVCTHGIEVWEPLSRVRRAALRKASLVLAPSKYTAEHVAADQQVPAERIRVLPWALDPQFEAQALAASRISLPGEFPKGRVILTIGRWVASERYKGMDTLITALPKLLTRWPELELVMIGQGDDRDWLQDLAEKNGVSMHVHFLAQLSGAELAACYAACEIFALPSRGEGFGMVYLEAMASGKPVIGGLHGGAPEVIQDGVTGYLVPHGDAAHLATCIETLLTNPALAQEMGRKGKERIEREFRFNVFAKTLKKIFREVCES